MQNQPKNRSSQKYDDSDPKVIEVESWLESLPQEQRNHYVGILRRAKKDGLDILTVGLICKNNYLGQNNEPRYSPTAFRSGVSRPLVGSELSRKSNFWHWFCFFTDLSRGFSEAKALRNVERLPHLLNKAIDRIPEAIASAEKYGPKRYV